MAKNITLAEEVAAMLRQAIADGGYPSGERLVELGIAHELHVSQNTVRDALAILEREGWVVKKARQGVFVRAFTRDEAAEVYALLAALRALVIEWALPKLTPEFLNGLRKLLAAAGVQLEIGATGGASESLENLHREIARVAGRVQTARLLEELHNQTRILAGVHQQRAPRTAAEQIAHLRGRLRWHTNLVEALAAGKLPDALAALRADVESESAALVSVLDPL